VVGYWIVGHPPRNSKYRAFFPSDEEHEPLEFLERDRVIAQTDLLIGTPAQRVEVPRGSGTWATIRYARQYRTPRVLIWTDGRTHRDDA
jgi:hypothetical protein